MKSTSLIVLAAVAALGLAGCASTGNRVLKDETQSSVQQKLTLGKSTKADVQAIYGKPMKVSFTDGGAEIWDYEFQQTQDSPVNYVPYANILYRSASGTQKELVVLFDKADVVQRVSLTESPILKKEGVFK